MKPRSMPPAPHATTPAPVRPVAAAALFREYVRLDKQRRAGALSPAEFGRWNELQRHLNATFSPPDRPEHEDRRESVRVPVRLDIQFQTAGELRRCLLTNLSRGGVFISTDSPPSIGTRLRLRIDVAQSGIHIEVDGEVVSNNVGQGFDTHRLGMGVKFVEPSPQAQAALDQLYERALQAGSKRS